MTPSRAALLLAFAMLALGVRGGTGTVCAAPHVESFDAGAPSWRPEFDRATVTPIGHRRQEFLTHGGSGAEQWQADLKPTGAAVRFVHSLPPAVVIDDLKLSVWVRATQPGATLGLRLVFPDRVDPATDGPLTVVLRGEQYATVNQWQKLTVAATRKAVQDELRRLRYRLDQPGLDLRGLYADQAVLTASFAGGAVEVLFDDLEYGPVVSPDLPETLRSVAVELPQPTAAAEFRLNRLSVEGQPFFPIIAPFHKEQGETVAGFAAAGANVAWIREYFDDDLLAELRQAGLWATATPPRATDEDGGVLGARQAGLPAFGSETRPILFWNLGPRIPSAALEELIGWTDQVRAADDLFARPNSADVTGGERPFSRHVQMLGASRHITHTAVSYDVYRDWLVSRRQAAYPGSFFWTWIQTEPATAATQVRDWSGRDPLVLEPEQLRLQVYAALSAGCRGVGYWKATPFEAEGPGAEERRLALAQLGMELELLGPLLATGAPPGRPITFAVTQDQPGSDGRRVRPGGSMTDLAGRRLSTGPFAPDARPSGVTQAAIVRTDAGTLLLPVWYGDGAQFCPGPMAANDVEIVVCGVDETASAWEITTTGVHSLPRVRVAGGTKITLRKFDQTTAVLFTSEPATIDRLQPQIERMAGRSAVTAVALAKAKRARTVATFDELASLGHAEPDGRQNVRTVDYLIQRAEVALSRREFAAAKEAADDAMQMSRILQRSHWETAVRAFSSPMSSPHAISYSTLPDHYRLVARFGRSVMEPSEAANLLPGGDFEEIEAMRDAGWEHEQGAAAPLIAGADLDPASPRQGHSALQLYAITPPNVAAPLLVDEVPVTVRSPAVRVRAGQVLHVSGWVRVPSAMPEHLDGATLYDNLLGPSGGLRWTRTGTPARPGDWEQFQLLREVPADGNYILTFTLHGAGRVEFDDLRVVPHDPRGSVAEAVPADPPASSRLGGLMDRIPKLPTRR